MSAQKPPAYVPQPTWHPGGTIRQELTTANGVQVRVKDFPPPEPRREPEPRESRRVVIMPLNQSAADWNATMRELDETWGPVIIRAAIRRGSAPRRRRT